MNTITNYLKQVLKFEAELVTPYGAYWGTIILLPNSSLLFISKQKLIEESTSKSKYLLRSMDVNQKIDSIEILIDFNDIVEVIGKLYMLNPIGVEIYTNSQFNESYFFNLFNNQSREKFLDCIWKFNPNIV